MRNLDQAMDDLLDHEVETDVRLPMRPRLIAELETTGHLVDIQTGNISEEPTGGEPVADHRVRAWRAAGLRPVPTEHFGDLEAPPANGRPWVKLVPVEEMKSAG